MAAEANTPVSAIDGIDSTKAADLARIGVHVVFDLLRGTTEQLHKAVRSSASVADVESWQSQAALLQVKAVTPGWAAALVRAGVLTVGELAGRSPTSISQILAPAPASGADVAMSDQIGQMLTDATVLSYTGCIPGTVFDRKRKPIAGVTVKLGDVKTETDVRGRFRLLRIRPGARLPLRLEHPQYRTQVVEQPSISSDVATIGAQKFQLEKGRNPKPRILSELNGDVVPVPPGQPIKQTMVAPEELRRGDILMLRELYEMRPDAQLLSRFKTLEDGVVLIRTVRVPLRRLPSNPPPSVGDHFRFNGKTFVRVAMTPRDLHREKVVRRLTKEFADRKEPRTRKQRVALIEEKLDYLMAHAFFTEEKHR